MAQLYSYRDRDLYCHHSLDGHPDPKNYPMHAHESLEMYYFISGSGCYLVEGTAYELHPKDILIMRQAETHKLIIAPDEPYERIAVHFPPELVRGFDEKLLDPFHKRPLGHENLYSGEEYPGLCAAFEDFDFSGSTQQRLHIIARVMLLLAELNDAYREKNTLRTPDSYSAQLVSYINEHLFEDISVQSVSTHFLKSSSQVSRDFRRLTGSTLWEYVVLKRLLAARALLQRGEGASKVSIECGFSDYSAFFRAYKAKFGYAPSREPR